MSRGCFKAEMFNGKNAFPALWMMQLKLLWSYLISLILNNVSTGERQEPFLKDESSLRIRATVFRGGKGGAGYIARVYITVTVGLLRAIVTLLKLTNENETHLGNLLNRLK